MKFIVVPMTLLKNSEQSWKACTMDCPVEQVPFRFSLKSPDGGRQRRRHDTPSCPRLFPATERDFKQDNAVVDHIYIGNKYTSNFQ